MFEEPNSVVICSGCDTLSCRTSTPGQSRSTDVTICSISRMNLTVLVFQEDLAEQERPGCQNCSDDRPRFFGAQRGFQIIRTLDEPVPRPVVRVFSEKRVTCVSPLPDHFFEVLVHRSPPRRILPSSRNSSYGLAFASVAAFRTLP